MNSSSQSVDVFADWKVVGPMTTEVLYLQSGPLFFLSFFSFSFVGPASNCIYRFGLH